MEFISSDFSFYILDFVLALALGLFVKFVVPYTKSKITTENLSFVKTWVDSAVLAAEQTIKGSEMGAKKKEWVIEFLKQLEITVDDTVDAMIEASVKALKSTTDVVTSAVVAAISEATNNRVNPSSANNIVDSITKNINQK